MNAYYKALEETKTYQPSGSKGYSNYIASGAADQEILKQNNTIINLLIQIIDKIEQVEHRLKLIEEAKENSSRIDSLITQINNLKLDNHSVNIKKKENNSILFGRK